MLKHTLLAVLLVTTLVAGTTGCEDRRSPVQQAVEWFPASQQEAARCIVWHESRNNPDAVGGAGEASLFQIHPTHARSFQRLTGRSYYRNAWNPILNGQFAAYLWKQSGWRPWSTARVCGLR